jgi:hypothetical protein
MASAQSKAPVVIPDRDREIEVSVVMPCLNEALTVGTCVAKAVAALKRLGVAGEVIVADNGSRDGSQDIARAHGARVVSCERRGYGATLQAGITAARGRFIIMGDSDDSYDFTGLEPFLRRLQAGDDLVMGNRFQGGIEAGAMPWHHRYVGNPILTGLLNLFFRTSIGDAHCGLRGFRRDAYERLGLRTPGMEFASEMVVRAALHRQKISEVPTTLSRDGRNRPPHLRSFRDGWRHLRFLLLMCPLWLYLIPAGLLLGAGLGLLTWISTRMDGAAVGLPAVLLATLSALLGYQTLWLGVFAKVHGWARGHFPLDALAPRVCKQLSLELGLVTGGALLLAGFGSCLWWSAEPCAAINYLVWGLTGVALGVQTMFCNFFLHLLTLAAAERPAVAREEARPLSRAA